MFVNWSKIEFFFVPDVIAKMKKASTKTEVDSSEEGEVKDDSDDNGWSPLINYILFVENHITFILIEVREVGF